MQKELQSIRELLVNEAKSWEPIESLPPQLGDRNTPQLMDVTGGCYWYDGFMAGTLA